MASFSMSSYVTPMSSPMGSPRQRVAPGAPMRLSNQDKYFRCVNAIDNEITREQSDALWVLLTPAHRIMWLEHFKNN